MFCHLISSQLVYDQSNSTLHRLSVYLRSQQDIVSKILPIFVQSISQLHSPLYTLNIDSSHVSHRQPVNLARLDSQPLKLADIDQWYNLTLHYTAQSDGVNRSTARE